MYNKIFSSELFSFGQKRKKNDNQLNPEEFLYYTEKTYIGRYKVVSMFGLISVLRPFNTF